MKNAYRVWAEIDLDALEHNIREIRSTIGDKTKLMCVIKSDAYGHGAVTFAKELLKMGADSFAVATLEEGIELRRNGIIQPILVLGFIAKEQYKDMILHNIMPTVYNYSQAKDINAAAIAAGTIVNVHIKLDTGMSRLGFPANENTVQSLVMIHMLRKNIHIQGMFSHLHCADCEDDHYTERQVDAFRYVARGLKEHGLDIQDLHISNSAAIMRYPDLQMDMVRAGIIIYGLYPSNEVDPALMPLKPVMSLKSRVVFLKTVAPNTTVGYGATFTCTRPTTIATVSIGYADGYPRSMSNKGRVLIGNHSFPVIGRVCMDQLMVDVTDCPDDIHRGDEVVLVGCQGSESISVEEVADQSDSFNYEFVCGISRRVPRVYTRNKEIVEVVNYLLD